jgi:hypothetical protein
MPRTGLYCVVLLERDRVFRVFGPMPKDTAASLRAKVIRRYKAEGYWITSVYKVKVIQHWDWNPDLDMENNEF